MKISIEQLVTFLRKHDGINDKAKLAKLVADNFLLTKDRVGPCIGQPGQA